MFNIIEKKELSPNTFQIKLYAPEIAKKTKPGHFIIIRTDRKGERIPISIADWDEEHLVLVITVVGESTKEMSLLEKGDKFLDVSGPLGKPSVLKKHGTVVIIGGGCGAAATYPQAKALKELGNRVITIIGARSKVHLIWTEMLKKVSNRVIITTDDGSEGKKGFVTDALKDLIRKDQIDKVIAIGPVIMMKNICEVTKDIKTIVSLNPIMVDGIGMCGACRVIISGKSRFACVEGPEFDGHEVDWDNLIDRNTCYDAKCSCEK